MDNAVAIVQAYLHVNGYFTVTEYPVIEATEHGRYKAVTDLDVLAFRFPGAGCLPSIDLSSEHDSVVDPALKCPPDQADMLVGEVKEGRAELNKGARNPNVLKAALTRFGCCSMSHSSQVVSQLLQSGISQTPSGHMVRLIAFGATANPAGKTRYHILTLGHVLKFLQGYLRRNWEVLHHAQFKHPAFGFLMTLEKAMRGDVDLSTPNVEVRG